MAKFQGPGSATGVDVAAEFYHTSVVRDKESGEVKTQFGAFYLHPDSPAAQGEHQDTLSLNTKTDPETKKKVKKDEAITVAQKETIIAAANGNTAPILNKEGEHVGDRYAFKADVFPLRSGSGMFPKLSTATASDLSAGTVGGRDLKERIIDVNVANKEARQTAKAEKAAAAPEAEAAVEPELQTVGAAEAEAELG